VSLTFLLDVNVLIASAYEWHVAHKLAHAWWQRSAGKPWATCPLTQAGFVRIISNPGFPPHPVSLAEALELLTAVTRRSGHRFWPLEVSLEEAVQPFAERLFGHRQVTDAYLLGLAIRNHGQLVTLDKGFRTLAGPELQNYLLVL
jgi:toxin-antitoxin system PIN domain toxin